MFSLGLLMKLKPGCFERYKALHDNLWPELAASMRDNGVNMVIYRRGEDELFLHATAPSPEHWRRSREHPILPRWQLLMTEMLEDDGRGDVKFERLKEVFAFGAFGLEEHA
ncbi:MAG: L-rhamnose mutarotase [Phycisphaeraceae bacterium]|nr:L-rhamnose mutarotase [Phycisphaeraceae bacterium]